MGKSLRVLIVEDSEDDARLILRELERGGYDPISKRVETREAMNSALKEGTWDIIIADYTLPHFSAPAALKVLHENGLDLPFIVVTGTVGEETAVEVMKAGAHDYLMKNNMKRLVAAVERELREADIRQQHRRADDVLKAERRQLYDILEAIPIMVCLLTPDYHVTFANRAFRDKFGESHGRRCYEYCFGKKEPCDFCETYRVLRTAKPHHWQVTTPEGTSVIDVYDFPFADVDSSPMILEMDIDITERKRAEEALIASEERYKALFESAAEGILIADIETKGLKYANPAICRMLGYSHEELTNMSVSDIHPKTSLEQVVAEFDAQAKGEKTLSSLPCLKKDGTIVYADINAAKAIIDGRECNIGFFTDITERKKMQEQLMAQDRLASIGQLVSGVAHEINNPLTGVIGFSDLLLSRDLPDNVKDDLKVINDEAKRTASIVKNLLTFARKQPEGKAPLDINENIQKVLNLRSHEQRVNNIQVIAHLASDLPQVLGNNSQLQQVFFNIVINAEFFMLEAHQKGNLTITTERVGDFVRCSFADDGPGISEEHMRNLFTPFFTTKGVGKGTGLGLSICHGIVTEHSGRIYAESEPGKGSTFIVELPVGEAATRQEPAE